jgi:hypothetical protein
MKTKLYFFLILAAMISPDLLLAQFNQQGSKLVGTGDDDVSFQGASVAISSDGNTAVVGGIGVDTSHGAIWVYTRTAGVWSQQGTKLVGTGVVGNSSILQGYSVDISSDGNTVIEGGYGDGDNLGAAWVFTRIGGVWTQQGSKLVGSGSIGTLVYQGWSVALSSDGNTAIVGGTGDNGTGAVWVFIRSGGVWTQQGTKLVGTGGVGQTNQGSSVAISADGTTFITGGIIDNGGLGAVWVFTLNSGVWVQQGPKLVGSDNIDASYQGYSVGLSSDGNTFIEGGPGDFAYEGATWVFTRSGGVWTQQGPKIYAEISTSPINVGHSVAITPDGNTAIVGSPGADKIWVFTRSSGVWTKQSSALAGTGTVGSARQGWSVAISGDGTFLEGGPYDNSGEGTAWVFHNPTLGIPEISNIPENSRLGQNYPNPFNQSSIVKIQILKSSATKVIVYDIMGREVSTLVNEVLNPGTYEFDVNGSNYTGGTYFYKLETDGFVEMKKMIVIK